MESVKVCILIPGFGGGGAEKQCIYLINELQKFEKIEIHVIFRDEGVNFYLLEHQNIKLWKLDNISFYNLKSWYRYFRLVKEIHPDIIFSWLHSSDLFAFFIKLLIKKIKWIIAERNSYYPFQFKFILRSFVGRFADLIIANSLAGKSYWLKHYVSDRKIVYIPNIVFSSDQPLEKQVLESDFVMYAGRLEPQKNVLFLTKCFCLLANKMRHLRFYIIGNGSLSSKISEIICSYKVGNRVFLLPFQTNILEYYRRCSVFVNVSLYEGTPNTIIENVALRNAVVVSRIQEHIDLLGDNFPYYLEDSNNVEELSNLILNAISTFDPDVHLTFAIDKLNNMKPEAISNKYLANILSFFDKPLN